MKLLNSVFALSIFIILFSCSSSDSNEDTLIENLQISSISQFSANEETQSITVTSNLNWTASENSNWISVSPSSGTNNGAISVSVAENSASSSRSGIVTVSGGDITRDLTITEAAAEEIVEGLDPNKSPAENFDLST